jgi:hypothetical protein
MDFPTRLRTHKERINRVFAKILQKLARGGANVLMVDATHIGK